MPSGVIRLRQSKKPNATKRMYADRDVISPESLSGTGQPKCNVDVGSGLMPKKSPSMKGYAPNTKPPLGRALPVRGEHMQNDNQQDMKG